MNYIVFSGFQLNVELICVWFVFATLGDCLEYQKKKLVEVNQNQEDCMFGWLIHSVSCSYCKSKWLLY